MTTARFEVFLAGLCLSRMAGGKQFVATDDTTKTVAEIGLTAHGDGSATLDIE